MNPVQAALRKPITTLVIVLGLAATGILGGLRMKADIFPALNLPVVYVCQPYGGMDPQQMEGLIANFYEYHFLYINGIHHVESRNIQGVSLMKLFFHPGTDMAQAMAELAPDAGMLFIHDDVEPLAYWMKNTYIPLDILYFDQDRLTARTEAGLTGMTTQIDTILDVWAEHDTFIQVIPGVATTVTF